MSANKILKPKGKEENFMQPQEKLLKLREILTEEIDSEIISQYYADHPEQTYRGPHPKGIITYIDGSGNISLCDKYELIANNGSRGIITSCILLFRSNLKGYTLMFYGDDIFESFNHFTLRMDFPKSDRNLCYFSKDNHKLGSPYGRDENEYLLKNEEMLENPEFKKYFLKLIQDIAPERVSEVQELLA